MSDRARMSLPHGTKGRILALALCGVVGAALYLGAVTPVMTLYGARAVRLAEIEATILRLQNGVADIPGLRQELAALREHADLAQLTLTGPSDAVAAARLQTTLAALATSGGSRIASTEGLAVQKQGEFRRVGVRVAISGDLATLTTLLAGVDASQPPLFVDNLELRSSTAATSSDHGSDGPILAITMDVYGFRAN